MDISKLKQMVESFDTMEAVRRAETEKRRQSILRERRQQMESDFRLALSIDAVDALGSAGFRFNATKDAGGIEITRIGSNKKMFVYPKRHRWEWAHMSYNLSSPEEELNLLSEIAFQFEV